MSIETLYRQFRNHSPFMLVGQNAKITLDAARTFEQWNELESAGFVGIRAEFDPDPDPSFYDTWPHLSERSKSELKNRYRSDCWIVQTFIVNDEGEETVIDSIGGCSGYDDPCCPFENCYVVDMMGETIKAYHVSNDQSS